MATIQKVATQELRQRLREDDEFEFWNVLTDDYFEGEMIPGSERVPLDRIGREVLERSIATDADIVVYCAGPECPQSRAAAEKLGALGYTNVKAYEGGLEQWKAAGLPIEAA